MIWDWSPFILKTNFRKFWFWLMTNQMTRFKPCQFKSPLADIRKLECYVSKQNYLGWMNKYPDPIISYRWNLIEILHYTNSLSLDLHFFNVTNNPDQEFKHIPHETLNFIFRQTLSNCLGDCCFAVWKNCSERTGWADLTANLTFYTSSSSQSGSGRN